MSLLEIDGVTKRFGGLLALDDVSFTVDRGEIVGLIGPNGSGKSTMFNCIMSVYDVTSGSIRFDGADITDDRTHEVVNRGLARVSQESNPVHDVSVAKNIKLFTLPNSVRSLRGGATDAEIASYAATVGIEAELESKPTELPHADVRRLEIAKALATEPELLLLDEPFAGMNQAEIGELVELIEEFSADGITIVIVDHNMGGLMELADRTVVLNNGVKLMEGSPDQVTSDSRVKKAYLGTTEET